MSRLTEIDYLELWMRESAPMYVKQVDAAPDKTDDGLLPIICTMDYIFDSRIAVLSKTGGWTYFSYENITEAPRWVKIIIGALAAGGIGPYEYLVRPVNRNLYFRGLEEGVLSFDKKTLDTYPCFEQACIKEGFIEDPREFEESTVDPDWDNLCVTDEEACKIVDDMISQPPHYYIGDLEAIDVIRNSLTYEELKGYYKGNILKYRLRAGNKNSDPTEDIDKANVYDRWLNELMEDKNDT